MRKDWILHQRLRRSCFSLPKNGAIHQGGLYIWNTKADRTWNIRAVNDNSERAVTEIALQERCWSSLRRLKNLFPIVTGASRRSRKQKDGNKDIPSFQQCLDVIRFSNCLPNGIRNFLAQPAPRPKSFTDLLVGIWKYESSLEEQPPWLTTGMSSDAIANHETLCKWWWSSIVGIASSSLQTLLRKSQSGNQAFQICSPVVGPTKKTQSKDRYRFFQN